MGQIVNLMSNDVARFDQVRFSSKNELLKTFMWFPALPNYARALNGKSRNILKLKLSSKVRVNCVDKYDTYEGCYMQRVLFEKLLKTFLNLFLFFSKRLRQLVYRFSHVDLVFSTLLKIFDHFQFAGHTTFTLYVYTGKETIM